MYKMTKEHRRKIGLANKDKKKPALTPEHRYKLGNSIRGKHHSIETRRKIGKKGELHWNWQGGKKPINERIRNSLEMKLWREAVFRRDNWTCVWCGIKFIKGITGVVQIQADHIKPFALFPELRFAIDNGRTLCIDCHRTTDTWGYSILTSKSVENDLPFLGK